MVIYNISVLPSRLMTLIRRWLNNFPVNNVNLAKWMCKLIPNSCPFEYDLKLWGDAIIHIPPLCKLNPFYEEFMQLRWRALSYLADECGFDIASFM
ncbi:Mo-dependent nitrogenase C-terminal domain-containing protein [Plectonema cf. radiosum LEGE 06105]|uniref:Mo-dependent nitrogenase C-terminal domain-containing protein n=2 Tax=Plectonema TaxID=1183 RepID=A0A8J7K462_9CYAN|nr:Mo-dependent nitrogenase C-terminal domain-containing protein [Plectonema cf. radiosum LEGE 06105]